MTDRSHHSHAGAHDGLLTAQGLGKAYERTQALHDVSLTIAAGEIVAITGASGSGKSTLLHCLCGILTPDAGEVRYGAERIDALADARRSELRRTVFGILFQFGQLVPELTAAENVALPLLLGGQRRGPALRAAREAMERLGVGELAGGRAGEMSGGQGQRVALARALVTAPRVLFADEPTGALDSLTGEQVLANLVRLAQEEGMTVVMVTHDAKVAAYADREVVMRDGTVEEPPPMRGLFDDPSPHALPVGAPACGALASDRGVRVGDRAPQVDAPTGGPDVREVWA